MVKSKANQARTKSRYRLKVEKGLVPHRYDYGSRSFLAGAFKNWPSGQPTIDGHWAHPALVKNDIQKLMMARASK